MPAERLLPTTEAKDLVALATELAREELAPLAGKYEEASQFPREQFRLLGKAGLLGLPYSERWGGGEVSYEVYLQVLEEIAAAWMSVGVGLSVHTMSCYALAHYGRDAQRDRWLPTMLEGHLLGAYALALLSLLLRSRKALGITALVIFTVVVSVPLSGVTGRS